MDDESGEYMSPGGMVPALFPLHQLSNVLFEFLHFQGFAFSLLLQQQQPFNGRLSGTTRVGRYQKKHSPAHTHPGQRTSFITFLHLQRSTASSLFSLRA